MNFHVNSVNHDDWRNNYGHSKYKPSYFYSSVGQKPLGAQLHIQQLHGDISDANINWEGHDSNSRPIQKYIFVRSE